MPFQDLPDEVLRQIAIQLAPDHLETVLALLLTSKSIHGALSRYPARLEAGLVVKTFDTAAIKRRWPASESGQGGGDEYLQGWRKHERRESERMEQERMKRRRRMKRRGGEVDEMEIDEGGGEAGGEGGIPQTLPKQPLFANGIRHTLVRQGDHEADSIEYEQDHGKGPMALDLAFEFRKRRHILRAIKTLFRYFKDQDFGILSLEEWSGPGPVERIRLPAYLRNWGLDEEELQAPGRRTRSKSKSLTLNPVLLTNVFDVFEGALVMILEHDLRNIPTLLDHGLTDLIFAVHVSVPRSQPIGPEWSAIFRLPCVLLTLLGSYIPPKEFATPRNLKLGSIGTTTQDPKIITALCLPGSELEIGHPTFELRKLAFASGRSVGWHESPLQHHSHGLFDTRSTFVADPLRHLTVPINRSITGSGQEQSPRRVAYSHINSLIHLMFFALTANGSYVETSRLRTRWNYYPPAEAIYTIRVAPTRAASVPSSSDPKKEAPSNQNEVPSAVLCKGYHTLTSRAEGTSPLIPLSIYLEPGMPMEQPAPLPSLRSLHNDLLWTALAGVPETRMGAHCDYWKGLLQGRWSGHYLYRAARGANWDEMMSEADAEDYEPPEDEEEISDVATEMDSVTEDEAGLQSDGSSSAEVKIPVSSSLEIERQPGSPQYPWTDPFYGGMFPLEFMMAESEPEEGLDVVHYIDGAQRWQLLEIEDVDGGLLRCEHELKAVLPRAFLECRVGLDYPARIIRGRGYDRFGLFELWGLVGSGQGKVTLMKSSPDRNRYPHSESVFTQAQKEDMLKFSTPDELNQCARQQRQPLTPLHQLPITRTAQELARMGVDRGFEEPSWLYQGMLLFGQNGHLCLSGSWLPPDIEEEYWGPFFMVRDEPF